MLSILFGLSSALTWGAADFFGGLASRKARAYQAVLFGEASGLLVLLVAAAFSRETSIDWFSWLCCTIAGSTGVLGLLLFFRALAKGKMSIASPVAATAGTFLPIIGGLIMQGFPGWLTLAGFALALMAIWFISQSGEGTKSLWLRLADLRLPLLAGVGFGVYLILIHMGSRSGFIWPLVSARSAGVLTMVIYTLVSRQQFLPARTTWLLIVLNGVLDVCGNGLYILAGQSGRMDVAAVLASLYPAVTVLLAGLILHERQNRLQFVGILTALVAIVLMTTG